MQIALPGGVLPAHREVPAIPHSSALLYVPFTLPDTGPCSGMSPPSFPFVSAACDPNVSKVLLKTLEDAAAEASKDKAERKIPMVKKTLLDAIDAVRGAVMICYPMGLPEWDLVRCCLEDMEDLAGTSVSADDSILCHFKLAGALLHVVY